ncbi:MAG: acyl-CoA thioesterase [candidate division KSB1 bacterium]|nr:acyl-CoA thioesterase [candidate division KSB1 bacterium]
MKKFSQSLKVRSYELDAQGHVNYAVYLNYLEYARVAALEQVGLRFDDYFKQGIYIVIVEVKIKYLAPATLGDELEITLEGVRLGRTSATFKQEIFNIQTGKKIVEAELVGVFINRAGKPIPIDEKFKQAFFEERC